MTHVACESNYMYVQLWGHSYIHDQETGLQLDVWSCIMFGLPTHLVQELNVITHRPFIQETKYTHSHIHKL